MQLAASHDIFVNNRIIHFLEALERRDTVAGQLFESRPWNPAEGDRMEFSIGALSAVAGTVSERQRIPVVDRAQSSTILKKQLQYGQAFEITKRMRKFNKAYDADSQAREAARGIMDGFDYDLTHQFFSEAENATYSHRTEGTINIAGVDSLAQATTAHTVVGTGATQYSNLAGGSSGLQLTTDNLVTAKQQPNQTAVDEYGTRIRAQYNTMVITQNTDMERKARQVFGSPKEPEVFENALNIFSDGTQKLVILTHGDTDDALDYDADLRFRWVLKSEELSRLNQKSMAQEPGIQLESIDENNLAARVAGDMFGAYACVSWQDKVYSPTTSSP